MSPDFLGRGYVGHLKVLVDAELALGLEAGFSPFQREAIVGVKAHVTKLGLIAGAGKRKMLLACANMPHAQNLSEFYLDSGADQQGGSRCL